MVLNAMREVLVPPAGRADEKDERAARKTRNAGSGSDGA